MNKLMKKNMKNYITLFVASLMAVSCVDTVILPDDKTVEEDMWKSKLQVQQNVNEAYRSFTVENVVSRLIVWGGLRSDELIPISGITSDIVDDLAEINLANIQPDNTYATWAAFYHVINQCNIVLASAAKAMVEDPSYTEGDYLADCSQMLALRSLCYFYLVRNFRDVPYTTEAYKEATQISDALPQVAPDSVLACCIHDLEIAEKNAVSASAYTDWRRVGYLTRDGIDALLADIYLWRGSVMHSAADYEQAIAYSDKVIESKKAQHVVGFGEVQTSEYPLAEGRRMFNELFVQQNAEESIFELQYMGTTSSANMGVCTHYAAYKKGSNVPYLYASNIFGFTASTNPVYRSSSMDDWRGKLNTYTQEQTASGFDVLEIRKYVKNSQETVQNLTDRLDAKASSNWSDSYKQNFIIYRLTDVMLMKAEALVGLALLTDEAAPEGVDTLDVEHLRPAFDLVDAVNRRAKPSTSILAGDVLKWGTYSTNVNDMEDLVMAERLRELAFEGKRWYDLLRYNYRHTTGVDYTTTLASQEARGLSFPATHKPMLELVKRKLSSKGEAVAAKLGTEPRLYMPIPLRDLKLNSLLHQTPGYSNDENISKQY